MVGAFITQTIKPGMEYTFLEWRRREGELARKTPGFIKRFMTRSVENPNVFFYTTFWETEAQIEAFTQTPEFAKARDEVGIRAVMAESETVRVWVSEVFDDESEL